MMDKRTFLWGLFIAGAVGVAQVLVSFDPETVKEPGTYIVALVGAFVRPAAAYVVAKLATS